MIVSHLQRIDDAGSIGDVWRLHVDLMAAYGFDRLFYVSTRFRTESSFGDLQDALCLTNHAPDYARSMIERGLIRQTPMMNRGRSGSWSWSVPVEPPAAGAAARLMSLVAAARARLGLLAGYDIVFREVSSRAGGAIELCAQADLSQSDVDALWDDHGVEIEILNRFMHRKMSHLPSWGGRRPLTPQQRRVLQWVSSGKTARDIATIMSLTPATVEKHLRLAREALDVDTTAQAVSKAAHWNQLFVDEQLLLAG